MEKEIHFGFLPIIYEHYTSGNIEKGKGLQKAGHVIDLIEKAGKVLSKVMRQTSVNKKPYDVTLLLDESRRVVQAVCNCIAGISGRCKHISAVVFAINEEDSSSKTDETCQWKQPAVKEAVKGKYSKGKKFQEMFPSKRNKFYESFQFSKENLAGINCMLRDTINAGIGPCKSERSEEKRIFIENFFRNIISAQESSPVLDELHAEPIILERNCCAETYNKIIFCNSFEICSKTFNCRKVWKKERKYRITASRCYSLFTFKGDWEKKCEKYFFAREFTSKYTEHGIKWEKQARLTYSRKNNCTVEEVGLVVCQGDTWLAVSPDGVILKEGKPVKLLEIKCPFVGKMKTAEEIIQHCHYLYKEDGEIKLKKKHMYYAQVQVGMAMLNLNTCDLIIFSSKDSTFVTVQVPYDFEWTKELLFKLKRIYIKNMLHFLCKKK